MNGRAVAPKGGRFMSRAGQLRRKIGEVFACANGWCYDAWRFYRYSGVILKGRSRASRAAQITKLYHMIEKGLALPDPRPGFGAWAISGLGIQVRRSIDAGGHGQEVQLAVDALAGYAEFNERAGVASSPAVVATIEHAARHNILPRVAPVKPVMPPDPAQGNELIDLIVSRHSVRQFSDAPVPDEVLHNATRAAQAAPCVCNRQASRVYFVRDPKLKQALLACQNGNRGFGDITPVVAVVTTNLDHFLEAPERYQPWIDGGLFTMNLLLGIHAQGYGACCLNWSAQPKQDRQLRRLGLIPDSENIITLIAIGALKPEYVVARSERNAVEDVMRIV